MTSWPHWRLTCAALAASWFRPCSLRWRQSICLPSGWVQHHTTHKHQHLFYQHSLRLHNNIIQPDTLYHNQCNHSVPQQLSHSLLLQLHNNNNNNNNNNHNFWDTPSHSPTANTSTICQLCVYTTSILSRFQHTTSQHSHARSSATTTLQRSHTQSSALTTTIWIIPHLLAYTTLNKHDTSTTSTSHASFTAISNHYSFNSTTESQQAQPYTISHHTQEHRSTTRRHSRRKSTKRHHSRHRSRHRSTTLCSRHHKSQHRSQRRRSTVHIAGNIPQTLTDPNPTIDHTLDTNQQHLLSNTHHHITTLHHYHNHQQHNYHLFHHHRYHQNAQVNTCSPLLPLLINNHLRHLLCFLPKYHHRLAWLTKSGPSPSPRTFTTPQHHRLSQQDKSTSHLASNTHHQHQLTPPTLQTNHSQHKQLITFKKPSNDKYNRIRQSSFRGNLPRVRDSYQIFNYQELEQRLHSATLQARELTAPSVYFRFLSDRDKSVRDMTAWLETRVPVGIDLPQEHITTTLAKYIVTTGMPINNTLTHITFHQHQQFRMWQLHLQNMPRNTTTSLSQAGNAYYHWAHATSESGILRNPTPRPNPTNMLWIHGGPKSSWLLLRNRTTSSTKSSIDTSAEKAMCHSSSQDNYGAHTQTSAHRRNMGRTRRSGHSRHSPQTTGSPLVHSLNTGTHLQHLDPWAWSKLLHTSTAHACAWRWVWRAAAAADRRANERLLIRQFHLRLLQYVIQFFIEIINFQESPPSYKYNVSLWYK